MYIKTKNSVYFSVLFFMTQGFYSQNRKFTIQTIAFYNVENFYDTLRKTKINGETYISESSQQWASKKYEKKISNIARVISEIGTTENVNSPIIIGLSEIESRYVLEDLIKDQKLIDKGYGIVHFDSPDRRGMDVALLYQKRFFQPTSYHNIPLVLSNLNGTGSKIYTRDQLLVTGILDGEIFHFIVNHWPSRDIGEKESSPYREAAAALNKKSIDSLQAINPKAKIITMGDMNDEPHNKSIRKVLGAKATKFDTKELEMYNPMEEIAVKGIGTLAYQDKWSLFDQIIITQTLIAGDYSTYTFWKANVFNKLFLTQQTGIFKGYPLRSSVNKVGYSDHFPVYIYLIKRNK